MKRWVLWIGGIFVALSLLGTLTDDPAERARTVATRGLVGLVVVLFAAE